MFMSFDARMQVVVEGLVFIWQVDQAITLCSEMHNIKEAIYENKSKLEGIGEDYQIQVGDVFISYGLCRLL